MRVWKFWGQRKGIFHPFMGISPRKLTETLQRSQGQPWEASPVLLTGGWEQPLPRPAGFSRLSSLCQWPWNTLSAVSVGSDRLTFFCFTSSKGQYYLLADAQYLGNHWFIYFRNFLGFFFLSFSGGRLKTCLYSILVKSRKFTYKYWFKDNKENVSRQNPPLP